LVVLGIFYPVIFAPLNSLDDPKLIQHYLNAENISFETIFTPGGGNYYRPLLEVSYLPAKYWWGLDESFLHLENILFHLLNVLLLFSVVRKAAQLLGVQSLWLPLSAALVFALHPINTEAVNWISGRSDLLTGVFLLASVRLLLNSKSHWLFSLCSAFFFILACLCKETAVFLLPAIVLLPAFCLKTNSNDKIIPAQMFKTWSTSFLFALAGGGYFVFRKLAFSEGDSGTSHVISQVAAEQGAELFAKGHIILKVAGFYLKKLFFPFPLNFAIIHVPDYYFYVGLIAVAIVLWTLFYRRLATFFILCAASVGSSALLIPFLRATWTPLAERYMYIPSAFFIAGVAVAIYHWQESVRCKQVIFICVSAVLLVFAYGTSNRNYLWQNNLALFQDTLDKSPEFEPAKNEIAKALYAQGRTVEASEIAASIHGPDYPETGQLLLVNKADHLLRSEDWDGALACLNQALASPGHHEGAIQKAFLSLYDYRMMKESGDPRVLYGQAIPHILRLYELTKNPFYQYRLGQAYLFLEKKTDAQKAFALAARLAPNTAHYHQAALKLSKSLAE
jgi:tetratricopeptide (TPR) repeat protein